MSCPYGLTQLSNLEEYCGNKCTRCLDEKMPDTRKHKFVRASRATIDARAKKNKVMKAIEGRQ